MSTWERNLDVLRSRFPSLADRVEQPGLRETVCSFKAKDGFPAYGLRKDAQVQPVTNPVDPGAQINRQMAEIQDSLRDFSRPVLMVGLYTGAELIHIFNLREQAAGNHCSQPVWVCIDSLLAFCGFLQTYDARTLLASERVTFFWHEEMPQQVNWLREHPEFSHVFTFFSLAPEATLDRIMAPFVELIREREVSTESCRAENQIYYQALSDKQLADNIAGRAAGRRPRMLVPSCSWSTVIQYSVRDTCSAFRKAGWDTQIVDGPAMLTPYHLIQSIRDFKPDLFLYVDHLRQEIADLVPDDLLVVSWVQDAMPAINNPDAARAWNVAAGKRNRDLIVGYVTQLPEFGYLENRLHPLGMIVDPEQFKLRELSDAQRKRFECDVCFASNCGLPTDRLVKERLSGLFAEHGLSEKQLMEFHDRLWTLYRSGETVTSYPQLVEVLQLNLDPLSETVQLLFWRLNDIIYRHVVIEWLDDYAQTHPDFRLHLYGKDWEQHPRFSRYAKGSVKHGEELSAAFQSARYCLHLNAAEGTHQRIGEILKSGGRPLCRIDSTSLQLYHDCKFDLESCREDEASLIVHARQFWSAWGLPPPVEAPSAFCDMPLKTMFSRRDELEEKNSSRDSLSCAGISPDGTAASVKNDIRSAVLNLLLPEQTEPTEVAGKLKMESPEEHSATWRTLCTAVFRQAGELDAADRFLPEESGELSSDFLRIIYATECCCAGRVEQALKEFRPFRNNRWLWDPVARLELATGQYRTLLDGLCDSPAAPLEQDVLRSVAAFYLNSPDALPLWNSSYDTSETAHYWRAVLYRENGDYAAAYAALAQAVELAPRSDWLKNCCRMEQAMMHFVEPAVSALPSQAMMTALLNSLQAPSDSVDFQEVYLFLRQGLTVHLMATHSLLAILAAAAAYVCGRQQEAAQFLQLWLPRYPASQAMLRDNGIHSRFAARFMQKVFNKTPGFESFFYQHTQPVSRVEGMDYEQKNR